MTIFFFYYEKIDIHAKSTAVVRWPFIDKADAINGALDACI